MRAEEVIKCWFCILLGVLLQRVTPTTFSQRDYEDYYDTHNDPGFPTSDNDFHHQTGDENGASSILRFIERTTADGNNKNKNCSRVSLPNFEYKYDFSRPARATFPRSTTEPARQTSSLLTWLWSPRTDVVAGGGRGKDAVVPPPSTSGNGVREQLLAPTSPRAYYVLARALLQGSEEAYGAGVAFGRGQFGEDANSLFAPFVFRPKDDDEDGALENSDGFEERDLSHDWHEGYDREDVAGSEWFVQAAAAANKSGSSNVRQLHQRLPSAGGGTDGTWCSPFFDCRSGGWLIAYSVPFFEGMTDERRLKGMVVLMFDLSKVDVNQCALADDSWFAGTHRCEPNTMQCNQIPGRGFRGGAYTCTCRHGFYFPTKSASDGDVRHAANGVFNGTWLESQPRGTKDVTGGWSCVPCRPGCETCEDDSPCFVEYDVFLRGLPLGVQSFCMTITLVVMVIVFRLRKSLTIAAGMWTVLEMILLGALFLYATVVCRYFEPTTVSCLLEPWFREFGFATCYGAIVLKMYRNLVEFRTRKAHRWVVRDKDLLKYLAAILLVVGGYMAAWTAINMHLLQDGHTLLAVGHTAAGLQYFICRSVWWEYVTEIGELLFLLFGVYLSYHLRNASSDFKEKRYLCLAIFIELVVSVGLHVMRHVVWLELDPDIIFLMYFARSQLTVTVILILIFAPKLWYYHRPPRDTLDPEHRGGSGGGDHVPGNLGHETVKLQDGVTSGGEVDISDINLADMDPEDIRAELRRVYTQLQILRNKTMRKDSPHISKRRGGRKATHRRFSLRAFHHRHRQATHHEAHEHEPEGSKTPEESTASADGAPAPTEAAAPTASTPTYCMTTTMAAANVEVTTAAAVAVPTVTFKGVPK